MDFNFGYNFSDNNDNMYNNESPPESNRNRGMLENGEQVLMAFGDVGSENSQSSIGESEGDTDNEAPTSPEEAPIPDCSPKTSADSEIMEAVLDALMKGKKILVECPQQYNRKTTIIKAMLKFWQWRKNGMRFDDLLDIDPTRIPIPYKIYIATRDFRETKKLLEEMKNESFLGLTQLLWRIRLGILDHRKNLCANEEVTVNDPDRADVNHKCRQLVQPLDVNVPSSSKKARHEVRTCEYYCNSSRDIDGALPFVSQSNVGAFGLQVAPQEVKDIEDLNEHCRATSRCPYYDVLNQSQQADVVICPVEFLLSPYLRDEYSIQLDGAIVLIDDGYDLENLCKREATMDMTLESLDSSVLFVTTLIENYQRQQNEDIGLPFLLNFLRKLSEWMTRVANTDSRPERGEILDILNNFNVHAMNISEVMNEILQFAKNSACSIPNSEASIIEILRKFITTLAILFQNNDSFCVKIEKRDSSSPLSSYLVTKLQIICADPSLIFEPVGNARSLIVGSNIIAPYSPFDSEFGVVFEEKVKVQDNMNKNRLLALYTSYGPTGVKFSMDFESRNDPEVMKEAGLALLEFCRNIPNGKIALFHSRSYFMKIKDFWQKTPIQQNGANIMDEIRSSTQVFCELDMPSDPNRQRLMMKMFEAAATMKEGAVLLALHRGKLYKDWDLGYKGVRGILHVSVPYGPWCTDNFILSKRKFLEIKHDERNCLPNKEWYHREMFRTANQSFCYTSAQDKNGWGIVLFLDSRMHGQRYEFNDMLPDWITRHTPQPSIQNYTPFSSLMDKLREKRDEWSLDV